MHIASVSKVITAMAMARIMKEHPSITPDTPIIGFLPVYWFKGANIGKITFKHLMTHTSGFATVSGETDFETMRLSVLLGVSTDSGAPVHLGGYRYENMNFGLLRILIAIINGNVDKNAILTDSAWDLVTILGYSMYVATHVFAPAGVTGATLDHNDAMALAYYFPPSGEGWNSGSLVTVSGGAGWHVSVHELLKVMGAFRRSGAIVPTDKAQAMLDNGFGIDVIQDTPAGRIYIKNGLWRNGGTLIARVEQALAFFLPENMELAVFANSYVGFPPQFFRDLVKNTYLNNLK
jgi:CubicO group peptidase (beta-lactamase class C family)